VEPVVECSGGEWHQRVASVRWIEAEATKMARGGQNKSNRGTRKRKGKAS
jgi:hypothetical protein